MLSISIFIIVSVNSLQVAVIIKTSQFRTTSTYLTLNLALCDLALTIFGVTPQTYILANRVPCVFALITNLFQRFFATLSKSLVMLISYDRYLHIKSPFRYSQILTTKRLILLQLMCFCAATFVTAFSSISHEVFHRKSQLPMILAISIAAIVTSYYYLKSIKLLKEMRLRRTSVSQNDSDLTRLAKYILLIFGCFHFTSYSIMIINFATNTQYKYSIYFLMKCFMIHYSPVNAVCFFYVNRGSKQFLRNLYRKYFKSSNVVNVNNELAEAANPQILENSQKFRRICWIHDNKNEGIEN